MKKQTFQCNCKLENISNGSFIYWMSRTERVNNQRKASKWQKAVVFIFEKSYLDDV